MGLKQKLAKLYEIEKVRYQRKGALNIIVAVTLLVCIVVGSSHLGRKYWPEQIENSNLFLIQSNCSFWRTHSAFTWRARFCTSFCTPLATGTWSRLTISTG